MDWAVYAEPALRKREIWVALVMKANCAQLTNTNPAFMPSGADTKDAPMASVRCIDTTGKGSCLELARYSGCWLPLPVPPYSIVSIRKKTPKGVLGD